jgi:hypothetical protein
VMVTVVSLDPVIAEGGATAVMLGTGFEFDGVGVGEEDGAGAGEPPPPQFTMKTIRDRSNRDRTHRVLFMSIAPAT